VTAAGMVDSPIEPRLSAATRRRCQFLAAPAWRAVQSVQPAVLITERCPHYYLEKQWEPSSDSLGAVPAEKRRRTDPLSGQAELRGSRDSTDSDLSDSDSESDSDEEEDQALPPLWPDPAMSDLLIQQACCPFDISLEPSIDSLENRWGACFMAPPERLCAHGGREYAEACSSTHSGQPRPSKAAEEVRMQPASSAAKPWRDFRHSQLELMDTSALQLPSVRVGYQEEWLDVAPAALSCWEKAPFEPYAAPKSVVYYVLCPEAMQTEAKCLMRDLSTAYEAAGLGSHRPAPPSGQHALGAIRTVSETVQPRPLTAAQALRAPPQPGGSSLAGGSAAAGGHRSSAALGGSREALFLHGLRSACQTLHRSLADSPPLSVLRYVGSLEEHWEAGATVVVYIVLPRRDSSSGSPAAAAGAGLAMPAFLEAAAHLAPATPAAALLGGSSPQLPSIDIALQVIAPGSLDDLSGASCRALAFSVYQKIRRQPAASDVQCTDNPPPPPTPPVIGFGGGGAAAAADHSGSASCSAEGGDNPVAEDSVPPGGAETEAAAEVLSDRPPQASSSLLHEPLFVLTPRLHGSADGSLALGGDEEKQEDVALHCCYAWGGDSCSSNSNSWVAVCWTDSRGELLEARLLPGPAAPSQTSGSRDHDGSLQGMCQTLLQETFRVAARTMAAAGSRAKLTQVVLTRLGPASSSELSAWETAIPHYCSGNSALRSAPSLETLSLVSLTSDPPLQLDTACETPSGAFLLQPLQGQDAEAVDGSQQTSHVVWLPQASPASMLLPGEINQVRVTHMELLRHVNLKDVMRPRHCTSPAAPATPSNGDNAISNSVVPDEATPMKSVVAQIATELHGLAALNATFHGLCLLRPATTDGTGLGAGGWAGLRAHLPIHCNVAQRLWALACGAEEWSHARRST